MPGNVSFIAGFAQSNVRVTFPFKVLHAHVHSQVGDTTPNTLGAFCESPGEDYDGQPCDFVHATCGTTVQDCHGR